MATTIKRDKKQDSVKYSSAAALNSERGSEWRIFSEGTVAPVQCVFPATSGVRACVTEISGWSKAATPQILRVRPGGTSAWGTCYWKMGLTAGTVDFDRKFNIPVWSDYSGSLFVEMTVDAGAEVQGISAAGFFEKQY